LIQFSNMVILDGRQSIAGIRNAVNTVGDTRFGIARRFAAASSSFVTIKHAAELSILGDMSFIGWIKPISYANYRMVLTKTNGAIAAPYALFLNNGSGTPVWFRGNGTSEAAFGNGNAPPLGEWSCIGVSQAGAVVTHYLNGIPNGSGSISATPADSGNPLYVGKRTDGYYFDGDMAFLRIIPRALSAAEMLFLAQNPPLPFGRSLRDDEYSRIPLSRIYKNTVSPAMRWWMGA